MSRMDRDDNDFPIRKNGRRSAHRRCDPPRNQDWSFRTTPDRFDRLEAAITACGHTSRADAIDHAVQLLASVLSQQPLPPWVSIAAVKS